MTEQYINDVLGTILLPESQLENLIKKYPDTVNWTYIAAHQKLSESFIDKYKDKVNWNTISVHQKL